MRCMFVSVIPNPSFDNRFSRREAALTGVAFSFPLQRNSSSPRRVQPIQIIRP